jgi:hypothetical protein
MAAAVGCLIKKTSKGYIEGIHLIVEMIRSLINFIFNGKMDGSLFCILSIGISLIVLEGYLLIGYSKIVSLTPVNGIVMAFIWFGIPLLMIPIYNASFDCIMDKDKRISEPENESTDDHMIRCLIKKASKEYVNAYHTIVELINDMIDFTFSGKMSPEGFIIACFMVAFSLLLAIFMIQSPSDLVRSHEWLILVIIGMSVGIPMLLTPIYSAVFDCIVDEDKRIVEDE